MINIALCDDEEQEVYTLHQIVMEQFEKYAVPFKIIDCSNGADLLYELDELGEFDLIFLDIELGIDNGIEVATEIRKRNPYCFIIFVSGYERYYKAAFSVQPYQFLDKPINKREVESVVDSVSKLIINNEQVFSFEYQRKQYRIYLNEILYFMRYQRRIVLQTKDGATYRFYGRIGDIENQLREISSDFLWIHKSFLVNMNYIKIFDNDRVLMQNEEEFPISARKHQNALDQYMSFLENGK